jgi:hypothetical protein
MDIWTDDGRSELVLGFYVLAWVIALAVTQMLAE